MKTPKLSDKDEVEIRAAYAEGGVTYRDLAANKSRREPCVFNEIVLCTMKSSQAWMKSSAYGFR